MKKGIKITTILFENGARVDIFKEDKETVRAYFEKPLETINYTIKFEENYESI